MQVALAFSFASDLEPLQDFGFECRAQSLYLSQAAGPDGTQLGPIIRIHPTRVISWGLGAAM